MYDSCNHDVDHVDATAEIWRVGAKELTAWGVTYSKQAILEITYCFACESVLGCVERCICCGASWLEDLFDNCPWCEGHAWLGGVA